jgi:hypothetical protein
MLAKRIANEDVLAVTACGWLRITYLGALDRFRRSGVA